MKHHTLYIALAGVLALSSLQANAQVVVSKGKLLISLDNTKGIPAEVQKTLETDLKRSGVIECVAQDRAAYDAKGSAHGSSLSGTLLDKKTGKTVLSKSYSGLGRMSAHQFADDIVKALTGVSGIATTQIVFVSKRTGAKELYLSNIDGSSVKQVTRDSVISGSPCLSADASQAAYTSYKSGFPDVYTISLSSGQRKRVAFFPGLNSGASFSPDGRKIALTLSKDGNPEIYTMGAEGGAATRITKTRGTEASASWSPDGQRIVYTSDDRGTPQLYISSVSGGTPERLTTGALYATEPVWSPSGQFIAFNTRVAGQFQVSLHDLNTKQTRQLTQSGNNEDPSWCRDSRHLVVSRSGKLVVLDIFSLETYEITNGFSDCTEPSCSR